MADRDFYQSEDFDRDRPGANRGYGRGRQGDFSTRRLDDRTGATPGSPGGYEQEARNRYPERGYGGREAERDYRGFEERSFRPARDYPDYDRGTYRPEFGADDGGFRSRRAYGTGSDRGPSYFPETDYGGHRPHSADMRDNDYRLAMERATPGAADYQSWPMNPYDAPWGVGSGFGFGHDLTPGYDAPGYEMRGRGRRSHHRDFWDKAGDEVASWFGDAAAEARRERDRRESHAGRGPKGYTRSDERIEEDVCERMTHDSWLDASGIEVKVKDREVTLDGKVASRDDKRRAELVAESASGVEHVQNNLRVDAQMIGGDRGVHETAVQPVGEYATMAKQTAAPIR